MLSGISAVTAKGASSWEIPAPRVAVMIIGGSAADAVSCAGAVIGAQTTAPRIIARSAFMTPFVRRMWTSHPAADSADQLRRVAFGEEQIRSVVRALHLNDIDLIVVHLLKDETRDKESSARSALRPEAEPHQVALTPSSAPGEG